MVEGNKKRIVPEPETPAASFCLRRRHQVRREEENEKKLGFQDWAAQLYTGADISGLL